MDEVQGAGEKWTELYLTYSEGVSQPATQQFAKSNVSTDGCAGWQDGAAHVGPVYLF